MKRILSGVLALSIISCMSGLQNAYAIDNNNNILKGIECGMTVSEVSETISEESVLQSESIVPTNDTHYKYTNYYNIENISNFNVNMKTLMFTEFAFIPDSGHSDSDMLINYGYHIGEYYNPETQKREYPYSESELSEAYYSIYDTLVQQYGEGTDHSANNEVAWDTEYGEIWLTYGMNLFGSDGMNKIILSCSDYSVLDKILGDVNGDSTINASDASDILSDYANISSGGTSSLNKDIADVNKDGKTDASDASMILAYYAYISSGNTGTFYKFRNI